MKPNQLKKSIKLIAESLNEAIEDSMIEREYSSYVTLGDYEAEFTVEIAFDRMGFEPNRVYEDTLKMVVYDTNTGDTVDDPELTAKLRDKAVFKAMTNQFQDLPP